MMNRLDIDIAASDIATSLHVAMRAGKFARVYFDSVKCAVAGYLAAGIDHADAHQIEDLENLSLRKFVERCA